MIRWCAEPGQTLSIEGIDLEYACFGPPPGEAATIVMLHEGLGCVEMWRDVPKQLSEVTGLGVLVYSRRGYGRSAAADQPFPVDYMTLEGENTLGKVMDASGLKEVILLGHSDGATIACIYAGSVSDMRVRGLVLIAPHFFTEPQGLAAIRSAGKAYRKGDLKSKLARYHDDIDGVFHRWYDVWTSPEFENWNVADAIDHLRIPVLAIQGRDDAYGTLAQIEEIDARIYSPLETSILDHCGHAPHFERGPETRHAIAEFCARLMRLEHQKIALA
ncbi:MAG: alpha/beta hydrolase [Paracoccaceae bacterium]|nr:alpha/beta hydrolase [Paracoccaceae bacterium]